MEDKEIVQLYLDRSELAIVETSAKYGNYCTSIAMNYFSVKSEEKLMESLRLTLAGYIYIDCDEFYVLYE